MVYNAFLDTVKEQLQQLLGDSCQITIHTIPKNNGNILDGLSIRQSDSPMSPTVYLNSYYQQYLEGLTMSEIVQDILALYFDNPIPVCISPEQMNRFDLLQDKIMLKVVHSASNEAFLTEIPHIHYLDLAIVFYLFLDRNETGQMTALVHNEHLELWGLTTTQLYTLALVNTPDTFPAVIKSMREVMLEMARDNLGESFDEALMDQLLGEESVLSPLYVLTNQTGLHGAGCIIYENVIKDFAEHLGKDIIILPSSIHEVLLTPDSPELSYEDLSAMVTSINCHEVPSEDQLSNQVYLYSRSDNAIRVVTDAAAFVGHTEVLLS